MGIVISCSLVAFAFARLRWKGRDVLFFILLATLMIPPEITLVPQYILFSKLGWIDTYLPLIVPAYFADNAFFVFLLRQFFLTIPRDLDDAARIDGASYFAIYWQIILPLSKPALVAVMIFAFQNNWNAFLQPLIYLQSRDLFTVGLGLSLFQEQFYTSWTPADGGVSRGDDPGAGGLFRPPAALYPGHHLHGNQGVARSQRPMRPAPVSMALDTQRRSPRCRVRFRLTRHGRSVESIPKIYGQFLSRRRWVADEALYDPSHPDADETGLRRDVMRAIERLAPTVVRWPGGCTGTSYDWRDGIGPSAERPRTIDAHFGYDVGNGFGTAEFVQFCRRLGGGAPD